MTNCSRMCLPLASGLLLIASTTSSLAGSARPTWANEKAPGTLIILNKSDNTASFIALKTGETVTIQPTGMGPHEVAVSPDGMTAIVANYGRGSQAGSSLTVLDVAQRAVTRTIDLGKYQRPHGLAFLPDGRHLLVTAEAQQALLVVDVTAGKVTHAVVTGQRTSHMVAVTPANSMAFVANIGSGTVSVIDLDKSELLATIPTGAGAEGIDISPDGKEIWVTNRGDDTISIIAAQSLRVVATLPSASFPIRLKFTPDGAYALVSNARSGEVAVFDVRAREEIHRIRMDVTAASDKEGRLFGGIFSESPVPIGIQVHPNGRFAYVAATNADQVLILDLSRWAVTGRFSSGKEPDGLGYSPIE